jgi:hypothetical protein
MQQMTMTGEDWRSDRDIKAQARAEAVRKKAALNCARKLDAACEALSEYLIACNDCRDESRSRGADDSRTILISHMREYANHLDGVFGK